MYLVRLQMVPLLGFPAIQALQVVKFVDGMTGGELSRTVGIASDLFKGLGMLYERTRLHRTCQVSWITLETSGS